MKPVHTHLLCQCPQNLQFIFSDGFKHCNFANDDYKLVSLIIHFNNIESANISSYHLNISISKNQTVEGAGGHGNTQAMGHFLGDKCIIVAPDGYERTW